MTSFIKIKVGQTVFDNAQQAQGVVLSIDYSTNTAQITTGSPSEEEPVTCWLSDLIVLGKASRPALKGLNKGYELVKEFHEAFDHPVGNSPVNITPNRAAVRSIWTVEEIIEFLQSSVSNKDEFLHLYDKLLEGMEKAKQKSLASGFPKTHKQKLVAQSDALTDALYFIFGSFVEMGTYPDKLFDIVQLANMSKLFTDADGNKYAKYRESDGKILKSPEFFEPESRLKEEIEKQSKQ